jgi:hypothetical protein
MMDYIHVHQVQVIPWQPERRCQNTTVDDTDASTVMLRSQACPAGSDDSLMYQEKWDLTLYYLQYTTWTSIENWILIKIPRPK